MNVTKLDDATLAFLLYAAEGEVEEMGELSKSFQENARGIHDDLFKEYEIRKLDYQQFWHTPEVCDKCGK